MTALRDMPDEVLLLQTWLSVKAVAGKLGTEADATRGIQLIREVNRRHLGAALLPAGRAVRVGL